ncbi:MAG: CopG family transcriptional regulator [Caulobacterales bacterium]|nr:CopG family transcriptional regulator [Caulobacterales bacterium]
MRTTLTIDDDLLAAAKALAERREQTLGAVVSDLMRQALRPPEVVLETRNGIPLLPVRGNAVVTPELVKALFEEEP